MGLFYSLFPTITSSEWTSESCRHDIHTNFLAGQPTQHRLDTTENRAQYVPEPAMSHPLQRSKQDQEPLV